MALKFNGRQVNGLLLRLRGVPGFEYAETNKASQRNIFAGQGITDKASGSPAGHLYPSAWIWPQKSGTMTAFRTTVGVATVAATLAAGVNLEASASGSTSINANLTAIAYSPASADGTSTASGTVELLAILSASSSGSSSVSGDAFISQVIVRDGSSTGSSTASADIGALYGIEASSSGSSSASASLFASGIMSGEVTPFTELSPQSLAAAVWAASVTENIDSGTMGRLLYNAGGGASPEIIAAAVWETLASSQTDPGSMAVLIKDIEVELAKRLKRSDFLALKD